MASVRKSKRLAAKKRKLKEIYDEIIKESPKKKRKLNKKQTKKKSGKVIVSIAYGGG